MSEESKKLQTVRGMRDILPEEHEYFTLVKKAVRHRCRQAGFKRITTPTLEYADVFERGVGDATDIVEKEMYTFESRSAKRMSMKPEGTAGIVRAYIEHGMSSWSQPVQFYYIEPHFRYDRPQKGRYRQFHQFGFEVIGARDFSIDAQIINLSYKILKDLGIVDRFELQVNTIGTPECRKSYEDALQNYFFGKERSLCEDCQRRAEKNPLRILDCKQEDCQILASMAPKFDDYLDDESREYYQNVLAFLTELGVPYVENKKLVRGLDYYSDTVFEFWDKTQGAQNAIGGGGRYDGLCELLGGQATPAVGVAFGVERVIAHMQEVNVEPPKKDKVHVYVACLGDFAKKKAVKILSDLHDAGIHALGAMGKASMRSQLKNADKFDVDWTIILGEIEVKENIAIIRNMERGAQETISLDDVVENIISKIDKKEIDRYEVGEGDF
ncbi:MAG: histidine--tRNA ligase [Candidatus Gracilibacteria bacterium]|nr:histidine--tRNA ligase [Candidatus Gracilibacteria bacterium]